VQIGSGVGVDPGSVGLGVGVGAGVGVPPGAVGFGVAGGRVGRGVERGPGGAVGPGPPPGVNGSVAVGPCSVAPGPTDGPAVAGGSLPSATAGNVAAGASVSAATAWSCFVAGNARSAAPRKITSEAVVRTIGRGPIGRRGGGANTAARRPIRPARTMAAGRSPGRTGVAARAAASRSVIRASCGGCARGSDGWAGQLGGCLGAGNAAMNGVAGFNRTAGGFGGIGGIGWVGIAATGYEGAVGWEAKVGWEMAVGGDTAVGWGTAAG